MGYYSTGHSMTGYYGDPSFWGAVKGAVGGFITGGWGGAIVGGIAGASGGGQRAPTPTASAAAASSFPAGGGQMSIPERAGYVAGRAVMAVRGHPVLTGAAAAGTAVAAEELFASRHGPVAMPGQVGGGARGYHMSKPYRCHGMVVPSHPVRNRRMNVCNPRALRRAARRAHGFLRLSRKLVRYYTPKHPKGKAYIHARRKSR